MICKFCGNEIDDNSDFCFVCGQKVTATPDDSDVTANETAADVPQDEAIPAPLPVSEPASAQEYADVDPKEVQQAGKFTRFICFICPWIGVIIYLIRAKQGETGKKRSVANATMAGVCLYLVIAIAFVVKKSMF